MEYRISQWSYRLLSIGGKLTLVKAVLTSIPVYWFSLLLVPKKIINMMRKLLFNFLWTGSLSSGGLVMAGWEQFSIPVSSGGWGIKDLHTFSEGLRLKSFWRALFGNTLWTKVVHCKYVKIKVSHWLRTPKKMCRGFHRSGEDS